MRPVRAKGFAFWILRTRLFLLPLLALAGLSNWPLAQSCPFCTAVAPSLCQQREAADVVALAEVQSKGTPATFQLHRIEKGASLLTDQEALTAPVEATPGQGSLVLLFGSLDDKQLRWTAVPVDETVTGYFFRAPTLREQQAVRLKYFAPFLEHANPTIAADAYNEFGAAPFDVVEKVAGEFSQARLRDWMLSDAVPPARKGFYGMLLGLAKDLRDQKANADLLRRLILAKQDDFRAGYDGILGGYLLLEEHAGLHLLEKHLLANPKAAVGDVHHAMTALRFYHEFGRQISAERLAAALANVLVRPEFAEAAITDLARWQACEYSEQIAALYDRPGFTTREIRRAVVGYLLACSTEESTRELARLQKSDPKGVEDAEATLKQLGRLPQ